MFGSLADQERAASGRERLNSNGSDERLHLRNDERLRLNHGLRNDQLLRRDDETTADDERGRDDLTHKQRLTNHGTRNDPGLGRSGERYERDDDGQAKRSETNHGAPPKRELMIDSNSDNNPARSS